jgi:hypothetical protein
MLSVTNKPFMSVITLNVIKLSVVAPNFCPDRELNQGKRKKAEKNISVSNQH